MSWAEIYPWEAPAPGEARIHRVYEQLREAIHSGALKPGGRLPSSRDLARRLGVARASVVAAYERLVGEGYAEGRAGSAPMSPAIFPGSWSCGRPGLRPAMPRRRRCRNVWPSWKRSTCRRPRLTRGRSPTAAR